MLARKCVRLSQFPNIASIINRQSTSMTSSSIEGLISSFSEFKFSPSKLLELPVEDNRENYVRRFLKGVVFSRVNPTPLSSPVLVAYSEDALVNILDLDPSVTRDEDFVEFVTGNSVLPDSTPLAHRYGGHQFGVWASQLGDGRAIILGEYHNRKGERWELQLKGSGLTPYSRDGDGRAVLRSSIREFLCSEAMYYLGIPTSRAATIVVSEDRVVRDPFYDGNPRLEPAAVVLRLAQSWFRIGSLEILGKYGETELLNTLLNFILKEHFPDIPDDENKLVNFLKKVYRLSSDLVVKWQMVGFTHGVLNSDNMSLLGITIDYGPFGFMESYDPLFVPNHSDSEARYCYGRQIQIVLLNMLLLTKAVSPIMPPGQAEAVAKLLQDEAKYIEENMMKSLSEKLGFPSAQPELVMMLTEIFEETKADFNMSFREMSENPLQTLSNPPSALWGLKELAKSEQYKSFLEHYSKKLADKGISDEARMEKMCQINPRYVLRNWMAESAIRKAEKGDYSEVSHLLNVLKNPFSRQEDAEKSNYAAKTPGWAKNLCLSCSS